MQRLGAGDPRARRCRGSATWCRRWAASRCISIRTIAELPAKPLEAALALVERMHEGRPRRPRTIRARGRGAGVLRAGVRARPRRKSAKKAELSAEEVAQRHAAGEYRVLMIGFAPGHAYMGGLDPKLAVPRRASPRARGAGGLGGDRQRADGGLSVRDLRRLERHRPHAAGAVRRRRARGRACSSPGDRVRFRAITRAEFVEIAAAQ